MGKLRCIGILLCYNDGDILEDAISNLLSANHDLLVWDHGSDDGTAQLLQRHKNNLLELRSIPREFDFYSLYQELSKHLIKNYIHKYDWVSWPDQDEILEGSDRSRSYESWLQTQYDNDIDYVQFNNFNFWFTEVDDSKIESPVNRIRHYSLFADCAPRIRSWRANKTNIRVFNHNPIDGIKAPVNFNLRHYPMRSKQQMLKRLYKDRAGLKRGNSNYHYENMIHHTDKLIISPDDLHFDNGIAELNNEIKFDWREVYGYAAAQNA